MNRIINDATPYLCIRIVTNYRKTRYDDRENQVVCSQNEAFQGLLLFRCGDQQGIQRLD